ncbi:MAG: hypothetical protein IMZ44_01005 [Planctomycetes bacterium]|nr:hypothetical protein [Planctomycetota bacterium]
MAEKKKFLLRIDSALWDDLQAWAADELRSVNGQIEYVLKQAVAARRRAAHSAQKEVARDRPRSP